MAPRKAEGKPAAEKEMAVLTADGAAAEPEKAPAKRVGRPRKTAAEKAETAKKETPKKETAAAKKTSAVKKTAAAAKKAATAAKKTVRRTAAAAKAAKTSVYVQYAGREASVEELTAAAKAAYLAAGHKGAEIQTLEIYVKPEESAAYYVVNGEGSDEFRITY